MSAFQLTSIIGVPLVVLFVAVVLVAFARPDRDEDTGVYASYLALASVFSLYVGLLALAALGEAVSQHLAFSDASTRDLLNAPSAYRTYFSLVSGGGPSPIAAFAALAALMGAVFVYHSRRRSELAASARPDSAAVRIDRAYRASICFSAVSLIAIGALVAGSAGYDFFAERVGSSSELRDAAMGSFIAYAGLVSVAGAVFRMNIWAIRDGEMDEDEGDPELADLQDLR